MTQEVLRVIKAINEFIKLNKRISISVREALDVLEKKGIHYEEKTFRANLRGSWKGLFDYRQAGGTTKDYQIYYTELNRK